MHTSILRTLLISSVATSAGVLPGSLRGQNEGDLRDAQSYASDMGVSVEEASRRLDLQTAIGELNAELESQEQSTFAGLYVEHEPTFRVVTRFIANGEQTLDRHIKAGPLAQFVQTQPAEMTLMQLQQTQKVALAAIRALGIRAEAGIDIRNNLAEVFVNAEGQQAVGAAKARGALQLPERAVTKAVAALSNPTADIYAGLTPSPECTLGFSVQNSSGTRGVVTAAHCTNSLSYNGSSLPYVSGMLTGSYDVQWHTAPAFTVRNLLYDGAGTRSITGSKSRTYQYVGEYVCHYGKTSRYGCGTIANKYYQPSGSTAGTFVIVDGGGSDISSTGDSGGPWFYGGTAYGIMTNEFNITNAVYMPVDYFSGIGVSLKTY